MKHDRLILMKFIINFGHTLSEYPVLHILSPQMLLQGIRNRSHSEIVTQSTSVSVCPSELLVADL